MPTTFCVVPSEEAVNSRRSWRKRGHTYMMIRSVLMIIQSVGRDSKNGPAVSIITLPRGSEITTEIRVKTSLKTAEEVSRTLESTVTTKVHSEIMTTVKSGTKVTAAALESTLQSELQSRLGVELTDTLRDAMTYTRRVDYEMSTEVNTAIRVPIVEDTQVVRHLVLRPVNWDVYLVGSDAVVLKWHRNLTGRRVRKITRSVASGLAKALFRLKIYEPQTETSIHLGEYVPEVDDAALVEVEELTCEVPRHTLPSLAPLSALARRTFPTTAETAKSLVATRKKPAKRPVRDDDVTPPPSDTITPSSMARLIRKVKTIRAGS